MISGELARDLAALHAEDRAVQVHVLAAGELGMKAGTDLEQAAYTSANLGAACRRSRDTGEHLEERRLASSVAPDHAEDLALVHLETRRRPAPRGTRGALGARAAIDAALHASSTHGGCHKRRCSSPMRYLFAKPVRSDRGSHQIVSAKRGSDERKTARPTEEECDADCGAQCHLAPVRCAAVDDRPPPAADRRPSSD